MTHAAVAAEPFQRDTLAGRFAQPSDSKQSPHDRGEEPTGGLAWLPPTDVLDAGSSIVVVMDLPGLDPEAIDIRLDRNVLLISGERAESSRALRRESRRGAFGRAFALPETVDRGRIQASYRDGVLRVELSKLPEAAPRRIEIQTP